MATVDRTDKREAPAEKQQAGRDVLGPDHPDRGQPGHLHQDRLRQPAGRRVPQHLVDLPRLQHLHEGQGPARRPLHHQPHLRHLRRQPRHLRRATRRTWPSASSRPPWASGSSTWARPPSTCSTTTSSRTTWSAWTSASRWSRRPIPACWDKAAADRRRRTPTIHGYRTIADIMTRAQPVHRRVLPRSAADEPHDARDVLPDGRPARPSLDALSRRRRHRAHACSSSPTTSSG